jgi:S1-C subfamily serine protease
MNKKLFAVVYVLIILFLCSNTIASSKNVLLTKNPQSTIQSKEIANPNAITGNLVFGGNPNNVQRIYLKSIPALVQIQVYLDYDRFLPNIEYIDWSHYNQQIERGQEAVYSDLDIQYDMKTNYYNILEEEYGQEYGSQVDNLPFGAGSGFLIHPKGYILTNAHVIAIRDNEIKEMIRNIYLVTQYMGMEDAYANDPDYTLDNYLDDWALYNFMYDHLEIRNLRIKNKVVFGVDKPGEKQFAQEYAPQIIDYELGNVNPETGFRDYKSLDWALLKIEGNNFPALALGDSDTVSIGSEVTVLGYPSISEGFTEEEENYDFKLDLEPTLATGYVSQITSIEKNKVFQIDVSIGTGNSGGPALDNNGNVIGIVTYGFEEYYPGGNFNYLLRINDIKQRIADKIQPTQSEVDQSWSDGLENFWNGSYSKAKDSFDNVYSLLPFHPYVQNILREVKNKIETEKLQEIEKAPQPSKPEEQVVFIPESPPPKSFSPIILMLIVIGGVIILLLILDISKRRGEKK